MGISIRFRRRNVNHDGEIVILEDALVTHDDFAAAKFFIRRTDEVDIDRQVSEILQSRSSQETHGSISRMAATVADAGQGIVFRQKGHLKNRFIGAMGDSTESRRLTGKLFFHFHAQGTAQIDVMLAGMVFFAR